MVVVIRSILIGILLVWVSMRSLVGGKVISDLNYITGEGRFEDSMKNIFAFFLSSYTRAVPNLETGVCLNRRGRGGGAAQQWAVWPYEKAQVCVSGVFGVSAGTGAVLGAALSGLVHGGGRGVNALCRSGWLRLRIGGAVTATKK
jgi:hypothetical protein